MASADALDDDHYIAWSDDDAGSAAELFSEHRSSDQNKKVDNKRPSKKRRVASEKPAKLDVIDERTVPQDEASETALKQQRRKEERRHRAEVNSLLRWKSFS
jgi:hypothetical protein